jgi:hypothetical protein
MGTKGEDEELEGDVEGLDPSDCFLRLPYKGR